MKWIEPKYSKTKVDKAGKLLKSDTGNKLLPKNLDIILNWRAAHAYPMQIMLDWLRRRALDIDKNAIAVQRLKRFSSIRKKLLSENNMCLSRMEDIGGCRVVLDDYKQVCQLYDKLMKSETENILWRKRNYILHPKSSGYRSIHLVYKYNCSKEKYKGLPVELQIRSSIQHSWATAVELVGTFTGEALKASKGNETWLEFFKLVSFEFAKLEDSNSTVYSKNNESFRKIKCLESQLDVIKRLNAFKVAAKQLSKLESSSKLESKKAYYILKLDVKKRTINARRYNINQLEKASNFYDSEEEENLENPDCDIVMIAAQSIKELKKAYPNYFSNTTNFVKNLRAVYKNNGSEI